MYEDNMDSPPTTSESLLAVKAYAMVILNF